MATENTFFSQFVVYDTKGAVDMKKSAANFTEKLQEWLKANAEIRPTILNELKEYARVGEQNLVIFTLHRLGMPLTDENKVLVKSEIDKLADSGKIVYQTAENGARKGRNAGWVLAEKVKASSAAA